MGDPKFSRRKYEFPKKPWEKERIDMENELIRKYGLKNKRELWKSQSLLKRYRARSRSLQARLRTGDSQAEIETQQLLEKLSKFGMLTDDGGQLDDVLGMEVETVLTRRLQSLVYFKGLANTPKQARQFIVHGHISVSGRKITIPGYMVSKNEEERIDYNPRSPISHDLHPMRPGAEPVVPQPAGQEGEAPSSEGAAVGESKPDGEAGQPVGEAPAAADAPSGDASPSPEGDKPEAPPTEADAGGAPEGDKKE